MGGAVQRRTWGMMRAVTRCACPGAGPWSGPCWRCGRLVTVETWTERHADGTATRHTRTTDAPLDWRIVAARLDGRVTGPCTNPGPSPV